MNDTYQTIQSSITRFFSGTALSRATGAGRDIFMAAAFGATPEVAAFMMAYRFAYLLRRLLGEGALHAAFVPHFEELRKDNPTGAVGFFRDVVATSLLVAIGCMGVAALVLWWLYPGMSPGNQQITSLTLVLLPCTLFLCWYAIQQSFLQCERIYFVGAVAPAVYNVVWIAVVWCLVGMESGSAMYWLAWGVVLASVVQWAMTRVSVGLQMRAFPRTKLRPFSPRVMLMARGLAYGVLGIGASQINGALDYIFARAADPSGPAYLWYSFRIAQAPVGLFGVAVAGAILPPLSRALKAGDEAQYQRFLDFAYRRSLWMTLPCFFGLLVLGGPMVGILYGRGSFTETDYLETTAALLAFTPGLIGSALVMIFAPAHFARGDYRGPAMASLLSVFVNIILNSICVFGFGWGASAVAAATSVSSLMNGVQLMWSHRWSGQLSYALKLSAYSGAGALCALVSLAYVPADHTEPLMIKLGATTLGALAFAAGYVAAWAVGSGRLRMARQA